MNRFVLLLFLLVSISKILPMDIITNSFNGNTTVFVIIPFNQFIFSAGNGEANYQSSINLLDNKNHRVFQRVFDINLLKQDVVDDAAYLLDFSIPTVPGNYKLTLMLRNTNLGDKKEQQSNVTISDSGNARNNILVADTGKFKFYPSSFNQLNAQLKSCFLIIDASAVYDSIMVKYEANSEENKIKVSIGTSNKIDFAPMLMKGALTKIEVLYYSDNIIDIPKWSLFHSNDDYTRTFSLNDQLLQIRYIANQNEWKSLKKTPEKDLQRAIESFWERHNNNPGTYKNETRDIFYSRVLKAEELFTIHKKLRGWKSDRGRIYIQYGTPDDVVEDFYNVQEYPNSRAYPHIRWYYYKAHKEFNFIDKTGYGNFQIMDEYYEN